MSDNTSRFATTDGDTLRSDDNGASKIQVAKIATGRSGVDGGVVTRTNPLALRAHSKESLLQSIGEGLDEMQRLMRARRSRRATGAGAPLVPITNSGAVPTIITGISPALGNDRGKTSVTISGSGFTGKSGATVGGVALTSFNVASDTTITGVTGVHAPGVVDVVVGTTTLSGAYEYLDATSRGTLLWWWRADKGATTSLGTLTALAEQAAASIGDNLAYNASGNAPGYFSGDANFNGRSSWGTSGADDAMLLTNESFASPGGTGNAYTVYHVFRIPTQSSGNNIYLRLGGAGSAANGVCLYGAPPTFTVGMGGAGLTITIPFDTTIVLTTIYNGASSAVYLNHYSAADYTGTIDIATWQLLALETGTYFDSESAQYVESEIAIYAGVHSSSLLQAIAQQYMGDAYGVPVT